MLFTTEDTILIKHYRLFYYYYLGRFIRKSAKTNKETRLTKI